MGELKLEKKVQFGQRLLFGNFNGAAWPYRGYVLRVLWALRSYKGFRASAKGNLPRPTWTRGATRAQWALLV